MPSSENKVIIACAGSGKTTRLVLDAIARPDRRIAFVTYTINNTREIINRFGERYGGVPKHVDVMTWFGFLLREGARPYQHAVYRGERIESICFEKGQSKRYIPETQTSEYYFAGGNQIYSKELARFIIRCEEASGKRVTARLRQVYTDVFVDECQDLAAWDWNFVEVLLRSDIRITLVGDPRQSILSTNLSSKNKRYRRAGITKLLENWEKVGLCQIETMNETRRCNGAICDFVNRLWPGMEDMTPLKEVQTEHDGVFLVAPSRVEDYIACFRPQVLRHQRRRNAPAYERAGLNFGVAKGMECDRVLIVPTEPIKKYLRTGELEHVKKGKDRLHVAITRAFQSVAFVYDGPSVVVPNRWAPAE
ncbi:MAG: UvrD-helicase domain-containing protein [Phycisphaerae bacterium]|nr:UvrD-helicase domain-containing protein [Phycisphaerae bacterium]